MDKAPTLDASVQERAQALVQIVHDCRLDLSTEKRVQEGIEAALAAQGLSFVREAHLGEQDIPDFLVEPGIVIECKIHGRSRKIETYRQLVRYAAHDRVQAIILASNLSMGLPPEIEGKPAYFASLSRGWM